MPPSPATHKAQPPSVGYTMGVIMLAVTMVALSGAYGIVTWLHGSLNLSGRSDSAATVERTLVGHRLLIPAGWLKGDEAQAEGFSSRVEFKVDLPLGAGESDRPIDVTLLPLSAIRPSASLLDGVYLHQFMPNELAGPAGLVGKPLYATEGYAGETVWYDALSQHPFVAKCSDPPDGVGPAQCLRTVALPGGIGAIYVFDSEALEGWKHFDPRMSAVFKQIGAL